MRVGRRLVSGSAARIRSEIPTRRGDGEEVAGPAAGSRVELDLPEGSSD